MNWSYASVYRASRLCDYLQIKAQSLFSEDRSLLKRSPLWVSLELNPLLDISDSPADVIGRWIVFHQIAVKTRNARLESDLHVLLTTEYLAPNTLQFMLASVYHEFMNLTADMGGYSDATRDFLLGPLGWTVSPYPLSLTLQFNAQLETDESVLRYKQ
jgi:hypothetical protein